MPVRILGITASSAPAAEELRKAQDVLDRVQGTYPKLVATIGEASAREAFDQAAAGLERARQDYQAALGATGGTR
jgi:GTP cyclohydrolase III